MKTIKTDSAQQYSKDSFDYALKSLHMYFRNDPVSKMEKRSDLYCRTAFALGVMIAGLMAVFSSAVI